MGEFNSPKGADFFQVWVQNMTKKNGSEGRLHIGSFQMGEESFPSSPFSPTLLKCKNGWPAEKHFSYDGVSAFTKPVKHSAAWKQV